MANPKTPKPSNSAPAVEAHDNAQLRNTGHPMLKNEAQVMKMLKNWQQLEDKEEVIVERIEEWKACVNRLAATSDGKHLMRMMIKFAGIFAAPNTANTVKMVENAGKAAFYLTHVRPYLEVTLRHDVE